MVTAADDRDRPGPMTYDRAFFDFVTREARPSADAIIGRFFDLMTPESVVDVGCAEGAWLRAVTDHGVTDVIGVDFDAPDGELQFPADRFVRHDLRAPLDLSRVFDLAISMEVAEHLPADCADTFVASVCKHAQVVLWSAALPLQGGEGHLNERWPDYWIDRFAAHGFNVSGRLRWDCWNDERIAGFYRQNQLVFASDEGLIDRPSFAKWFAGPHGDFTIRVVHPAQFGEKLGVRFI